MDNANSSLVNGSELTQRKKRRRRGWDVTNDEVVSGSSATVVAQPSIESSRTSESGVLNVATNDPLGSVLSNNRTLQQNPLVQLMQSSAHSGQVGQQLSNRIYVGSINYELQEDDILKLFALFGGISKVEMSQDPATGKSKGFCFIDFEDPKAAEAAQVMDGFELAGRNLKVGRPNKNSSGISTVPLPQSNTLKPIVNPLTPTMANSTNSEINTVTQTNSISPTKSSNSNASSTGAKNWLLVNNILDGLDEDALRPIFEAFGTVLTCRLVDEPNSLSKKTRSAYIEFPTETAANATAIAMHEFDIGGFKLETQNICNPFENKETLTTFNKTEMGQISQAKVRPNATTSGSKCVLLKNMITFEDTKDPDLKTEIGEEACKYGELNEIQIISDDPENITVALKYFNCSDAESAYKNLNGRAFGNKKITAELLR